jgi:hypothetical protein
MARGEVHQLDYANPTPLFARATCSATDWACNGDHPSPAEGFHDHIASRPRRGGPLPDCRGSPIGLVGRRSVCSVAVGRRRSRLGTFGFLWLSRRAKDSAIGPCLPVLWRDAIAEEAGTGHVDCRRQVWSPDRGRRRNRRGRQTSSGLSGRLGSWLRSGKGERVSRQRTGPR